MLSFLKSDSGFHGQNHFMLTGRGVAPVASEELSCTAGNVSFYSTSVVGVTKTEVPYKDNDYEVERRRAIDKYTPEGVKPMSKEEEQAEQHLTKQILKKFASNVSQSISFPVIFSEPRSNLERIADLCSFLVNIYIPKAIEEEDSNMKLAYLACGVMASFHLDMQSKKPFNPMIGETFVTKWPNGAEFYAEQTSHHPPIAAFQIIGPDNSYKISSHCCINVESGISQVEIQQKGLFTLEFPDGGIFEWEFPTIVVCGTVKGSRIVKVKGPFNMWDRVNEMECHIKINPKKDRKRGINDSNASTCWGGLRPTGDKGYEQVFKGDYCKQILFEDEPMWTIEDDLASRPNVEIADDDLLLSDDRYRLDRSLFIQGNNDEADKAKLALEDMQRREEKMRMGSKKGIMKKSPSKGA